MLAILRIQSLRKSVLVPREGPSGAWKRGKNKRPFTWPSSVNQSAMPLHSGGDNLVTQIDEKKWNWHLLNRRVKRTDQWTDVAPWYVLQKVLKWHQLKNAHLDIHLRDRPTDRGTKQHQVWMWACGNQVGKAKLKMDWSEDLLTNWQTDKWSHGETDR